MVSEQRGPNPPWTDSYPLKTPELKYDISVNEPPSTAILNALSEISETGPTSLGPLYQKIDLEEVDALLESPSDHSTETHCSIHFSFNGYYVITDTNHVTIYSKKRLEHEQVASSHE